MFAVKTGWAVLLALVLALFSSLKDSQAPGKSRVRRVLKRAYLFAPYLLFLGVFSTLAIRSSLNIGHRHILPLYPPIFLFLGSLGPWLLSKDLWKRVLIFLLGAIMLLQCAWIYPHYLSFFNGIISPKEAYRYLVDSNVDWGQDLPRLKDWLDERSLNRATEEEGDVVISYFGFAKPSFYEVNALDRAGFHTKNEVLSPRPWSFGYFCVSVSVYQTVYSAAPGPWKPSYEKNYQRLKGNMEEFWAAEKKGQEKELVMSNRAEWRRRFFLYEHFSVARLCAYLKNRKPYDRIAYSILIFKLSEDDIEQAFEGPPPYGNEK